MPVKVSVIIPVYNAAAHLRECLDGVLQQTLREIEVICVDDGSTDESPEILKEYQQKDDRVQVIRQANAGAGAARNNGLQYAKGEYLSILDADDFYEPNMLETAYEAAKKADAQIAVFACDLYENTTGKYRPCTYSIRESLLPDHQPFAATDVSSDIFKLFVGWAWDKLFKASFVKENGLYFQEQRTTNDMLFVFSAVVRAQRIITLSQVLIHHRREAGSLSVTREKSWMCFYNALIALRDQLNTWGLYQRFEQDYLNYCVHFSLWNLNTLAEPTRTKLYNQLRDEWFRELGVLDHPMEYFYNRKEYLEFRSVYEHPADWKPNLQQSRQQEKLQDQSLIKRGIMCLKDNGFRYTVKNILGKLGLR